MVHSLVAWSVRSRLVVILLIVVLAVVGGYAFFNVDVEAYPDPAPAIIEVIALFPGASAEEVERQITIPLEVAVAGIPGLKETRSKSLFGLAYVSNQFDYSVEYTRARQEVIIRLQQAELPGGVTPQISPASPIAEILEYIVTSPTDAAGQSIYELRDLKAVQDWTLQRAFRRVPRIADSVSLGGPVKRYEVHPDPDRLKQYGVTLQQLQSSIASSNANAGGDFVVQGHTVQVVRGLGLLGGGLDPQQQVLGMTDPAAAARVLRGEEQERIQEIRSIVLSSTNNVPVRVEHVVNGGPLQSSDDPGKRGVVISQRTRLGQTGLSRPVLDEEGREALDENGQRRWTDQHDVVQGTIYMRKGEESLPALKDVKAIIREVNNEAGRVPVGIKIDPYYDRTELIDVTTETVRENLLSGMALVTVILLMFLSNVRTALIVAINIPLALAFAFAVLVLRGRSANLLSIGAVDFGIIVDSSVIMVENIYRYLGSGEGSDVPLRDRIVRASSEVGRSLYFSTLIMVCALLPLFTMKGPEGQIFGPMADTYAFALAGALLLSVTLSPVLCELLLRHLKPARDNMIVRPLKAFYLWQLAWCLNHRILSLAVVAGILMATLLKLPGLGREFMPELEEGNMYIRAVFPINISLQEAAEKARIARGIMQKYPEVGLIMSQTGRPDAGTDPGGFYNTEFLVPLKPFQKWPEVKARQGWLARFRPKRARTKPELIEEMNHELERTLVGVDWNFSQNIRDNVLEVLSGVKAENSVKIIGPDLDELEKLAESVKNELVDVPGIVSPGVFRIKGQSNLELAVDRAKCAQWNVSVADVHNTIETAIGGKAFTQMIEGEKSFDITLRWPAALRSDLEAILDIPVDVTNNLVTSSARPLVVPTPQTGSSSGVATTGTSAAFPSLTGGQMHGPFASLGTLPRRRLRDLVTPRNDKGQPDPQGSFIRPGASSISREQGNRLIAVKFGVRGRDLASTVGDAQAKVNPLVKPPYRIAWSGEFQEMEEAEHRLVWIVSLSLTLILVLLYLAFRSLLDAVVVLSNVLVLSMGGIWALIATGTNFNVSAAVGFISILGVGVMNGLLQVSAFNSMRMQGVPLREALFGGMEKLIRPVTMTALAAILGLLPAALSARIGSESQKPLAIVVVGGMIMTLLLTNLVPLLYSFYGQRQPPAEAAGLGH